MCFSYSWLAFLRLACRTIGGRLLRQSTCKPPPVREYVQLDVVALMYSVYEILPPNAHSRSASSEMCRPVHARAIA